MITWEIFTIIIEGNYYSSLMYYLSQFNKIKYSREKNSKNANRNVSQKSSLIFIL